MNKLYILCIVNMLLFAIPKSHSQEVKDSAWMNLEQVIISANKVAEDKSKVAQQVQVITARHIAQLNPQTSADALMLTGQAFVQKSQMGGGSIVLRGLEASRVLMLIDGVRMNNIMYRAGHLQNAITVDNNMLSRMEVLFGPASTIYGSDALGGAVHFYTRKPILASGDGVYFYPKMNLMTRFSSANQEKTIHGDINLGFRKWAFLTSLTYSDFEDMRTGTKRSDKYAAFGTRPYYIQRFGQKDSLVKNSDINVQRFSAYRQMDVLQKVLFQPNENTAHQLNFQLSNSSDIPRYDRLTDTDPKTTLRFAEWYYTPQKRALLAYDFNIERQNAFFQHTHLGINYQAIEEGRAQRRVASNNLDKRVDNANVWAANLDFQHKTTQHDLRFGADIQYNTLKSSAERLNIATNVLSGLDTRYPNGKNWMNNVAIYGTHTWKITPKWVLNDGIRLTNIQLYSQFLDKTYFPFPYSEVKQNNTAFSGNLGLIYNANASTHLAVLGSSGFRAPNVDDLAKVFESTTGTLIVPNPNLKPEYAYNLEMSIGKTFSNKYKFEATLWYDWLKDAIVTDKFSYNGSDSIVYNGVKSQVLANQNKNRAFIYGYSLFAKLFLTEHFTFNGAYTYTYGRIKKENATTPLDHIPPAFGRMSLKFDDNRWSAELYYLFNGKKDIKDYLLNAEDNEKYATPEGTLAWSTLNINAAYPIFDNNGKRLLLQLAVENIFDVHYRPFASGFSAAGRNFKVALRGSF